MRKTKQKGNKESLVKYRVLEGEEVRKVTKLLRKCGGRGDIMWEEKETRKGKLVNGEGRRGRGGKIWEGSKTCPKKV